MNNIENIRVLRNALSLVMLLSFIAACSLTGRAGAPPTKVFLLDDRSAAASFGDRSLRCLSLRIAAPRAAAGFNTRRMAYTRPGEALQYYAWHEWADTPAQLLAAMAERRFDGIDAFSHVISGAADLSTNLRLDLDDVSLLQTVSGSSSQVTVRAKARLIDVGSRRLLGSWPMIIDEPADGANPIAGVAAAERAMSELLDTLVDVVLNSAAAITCDEATD